MFTNIINKIHDIIFKALSLVIKLEPTPEPSVISEAEFIKKFEVSGESSSLRINNAPWPASLESKNLLLIGSSSSDKTHIVSDILTQLRTLNKKAIIVESRFKAELDEHFDEYRDVYFTNDLDLDGWITDGLPGFLFMRPEYISGLNSTLLPENKIYVVLDDICEIQNLSATAVTALTLLLKDNNYVTICTASSVTDIYKNYGHTDVPVRVFKEFGSVMAFKTKCLETAACLSELFGKEKVLYETFYMMPGPDDSRFARRYESIVSPGELYYLRNHEFYLKLKNQKLIEGEIIPKSGF